MIQFIIPGKVQAQERPRFSRAGKGVKTHDAPKSKNYKEFVKLIAMQNKPQEPLHGALRLEVDIYVMPPKKYHTKPKLRLIDCGELRPVTKPDTDNLVKGIKDGMNGIIWGDDAQIVELVARKWYSMEPRAEIKVQQISICMEIK